MKSTTIPSSNVYLWKLKYNTDSIIDWLQRFTVSVKTKIPWRILKKINSNSLSSFWIHLNLLNEILLPGRGQKPIIKEETLSKTWYQKRSPKCNHKVTDLENMRDYASIKVTQLEQELTKTNKTVRQKANSWFATVTTKTASQLKPFPASQKPPGDTQCQLAIALDIVIISIINTVIVFFFCYCYYYRHCCRVIKK